MNASTDRFLESVSQAFKGCAKNKGLISTLEKQIYSKIISLCIDSQLIGALGAAVLAVEEAQTKAN